MPKIAEAEMLARDAERDLDAELIEAASQLRDGKVGRVSLVLDDGRVIDSPVTKPSSPSCSACRNELRELANG
jgi:hypothetical protein